MMSNERQSQASTPVVVANDNWKNIQKQKVALCKTKRAKQLILTFICLPIQRTGSDRSCHSNSMSWVLSQWRNEKMK